MGHKIILNVLPPASVELPSAPLTVLKAFLARHGQKSYIIGWNVMAHKQVKNIKFNLDIAKDLPLINGNHKQLMQVFINILNNAIDAMPDGGSIHVSAKCSCENGGKKDRCIVVCIKDAGTGIPQEHLSKVFDPFFTSKRPGKGTGLGLAICQRIVDNHKGRISIESTSNKGTKVICHLPIPS